MHESVAAAPVVSVQNTVGSLQQPPVLTHICLFKLKMLQHLILPETETVRWSSFLVLTPTRKRSYGHVLSLNVLQTVVVAVVVSSS